MKRTLLTVSTVLITLLSFAQQQKDTQLRERLEKHVYYFASDSLRGRKAGSADAEKAAKYIVAEWEKMGLKPYNGEYVHTFTQGEKTYRNLLGVIEGSDAQLKDEIIVIGAHYDHLGVKNDSVVYNGADDNASGSAAVLEMARLLLQNKEEMGRTIIIAAFDGEELGLYGSNYLASELRRENVVLMISADMVGWYAPSGHLIIEGYGTIGEEGQEAVLQAAGAAGINLKLKNFENSILTATDTRGFAQQGRATLAVTTGTKSPYHKPEDTAEKIDYDGLESVAEFLADFVSRVATDPGYLPSGKVAKIHRSKPAFAEFTLRGGIGSSSLAFGHSSAISGKSRTSFSAAAEVELHFFRKFSLRPGAVISADNCWLPNPENQLESRYRFGFRQIKFPADIIWRPGDFYLGAGPYFNKVLKAKLDGERFNPEDLGLKKQGWGYDILLGLKEGPFSMELKFYRPVYRISQSPALIISEKARQNSFMFTIGWTF